jgi:hypothetical protein
MSITPQIVHLLREVIAGRLPVQLEGRFDEMGHCYVSAEIDSWLVKFWMRDHITRVAEVVAPDYGAVDYEEDGFVEHWLPSPSDSPEWWELMRGYELLTPEELAADLKWKVGLLAALRPETPERLAAYDAVGKAQERYGAYNPWSYLNEAEQIAFEETLRARGRRGHLRLVVGGKGAGHL